MTWRDPTPNQALGYALLFWLGTLAVAWATTRGR